MSIKKNRLELNWVGKYDQVRHEPRVLVEDKSNSYGDPNSENMLIYGDNLLALKALEQDFAGKVKCIYIDPPYNTGNAFEHYDDGLEHSLWLSMMKERLILIYNLLSKDGSLWISIDDDECHYLKILCDEIFGRHNYITSCLWQKIHSIKNDAKHLSVNHDYILVYAKNPDLIKFNLLERTDKMNARYKNPDNDPRGPWQSGDLVANEERTNGYFDIVGPTGKTFNVPQGKHWVYAQDTLNEMIRDNRVWFGKSGEAFPRKKRFLSEVQQGRKADTWWGSDDVGHNQEGKREAKSLNREDIFPTPKPERLLHRIISVASSPNDYILDSFAGSGTTGAVAHKMNRKWIMIELGDHCHSHIIPRMKQIVDGTDKSGITDSVSWESGGGFKYFRLAESLLVQDKELSTIGHPIYIINPRYDEDLLIKSICKIEGFKFRNNGRLHGISSETRFLHVTTLLLNQVYLDSLAEDVGPDQSLLIYCTRRSRKLVIPDNIEIKKIPKDLLNKCDFEEDK